MENINIIDGWEELIEFFPSNYQEMAIRNNVMKRNRADKDLLNAMRVFFIHLGLGYSLKETALRAKEANLGTISSVALFHRFKKFGPFFKELCQAMMLDNHKSALKSNWRIKLIDATIINETGKNGSSYRFHYCYSLPELSCNFTKLTPVKGKGNGESFKHFPIAIKDLCIADAGYSSFQGIEHVVNSGGDVCVRVNKQILHTYKLDGEELDLHKWLLSKNMKEGQIAHMPCLVKGADENLNVRGRLCIIKKDKAAIKKAEADLKKNCTKSQLENLKGDTRFLRQFIILFTTLPEEDYDAKKCSICIV